jgi:glycosyltransferase involved in cell wall biosynthesis
VSNISGLSVFIITLNEENDISACLESVKDLAGEIVVVDSGSTDRTLDICRTYTDKVFSHPFMGFSAQKQFALEKAQGPWVLNLDADERVSPELAEEIKSTLTKETPDPSVHGFEIPFKNCFLGKRLHFGAGKFEKHVRLFLKSNASYGKEDVHEGIRVSRIIGKLRAPILHYSYRDVHDYLEKCNSYTSLLARKKFSLGERFHLWHHLRLPSEFFIRYVLKLGFLDGSVGFTYALLSSYYVWLKYIKLKDLERSGL